MPQAMHCSVSAFRSGCGLADIGAVIFLLFGARLIYGSLASPFRRPRRPTSPIRPTNKTRSAGMALIAASGGIGTIIGPAFGGLLARVGAVVPMYAASVLALVAAILAAAKLTEPPRHVDTENRCKAADSGWSDFSVSARLVRDLHGVYRRSGNHCLLHRGSFWRNGSRRGDQRREHCVAIHGGRDAHGADRRHAGWKLPPKVLLRTAYFVFRGHIIAICIQQQLALYVLFHMPAWVCHLRSLHRV